jgi:hypothetical protein
MNSLFLRLTVPVVLLLAVAALAYGQTVSPPQAPLEGTGPPGNASTDFPSGAATNFPTTTGSTDFPSTTNPEGFNTTMPESGTGTGTDSTLGGSGTGSGGLGASTYAPYTESTLGAGR